MSADEALRGKSPVAGLASYRRCQERIAAAWPAFQAKRVERLVQQERFGTAAEKVAENILEDLFTTVLDWRLSEVNNQVAYADIVLTRLGVKQLIVEVKRPGALAWNERAVDRALAQARRYADEQKVKCIAVSDGTMLYARDAVPGGYHDRLFVRLDEPTSLCIGDQGVVPANGTLLWFRPLVARVVGLLRFVNSALDLVVAEVAQELCCPADFLLVVNLGLPPGLVQILPFDGMQCRVLVKGKERLHVGRCHLVSRTAAVPGHLSPSHSIPKLARLQHQASGGGTAREGNRHGLARCVSREVRAVLRA